MDLSKVDLNLLIVFEAVHAERSVTRAGRRLGLSQPAVSGALARLREQFGDELFVRGPGGMEPTALANHLAAPLREILAQMERLLVENVPFEPAKAAGSVRIAVSDHGASLFLPALLAAVTREAPALHLAIHDIGDLRSTLERLEAGELDIALGYFEKLPERFCTRALGSARLVVVVRKGHPRVVGGRMDRATYLDLSHLAFSFSGEGQSALDQHLARCGEQRRIAVTLPYTGPVARVIAATDLAVTVASSIAEAYRQEQEVEVHPLPFELPPASASVIWHRRRDNDGLLRWVRERLAAPAPSGE